MVYHQSLSFYITKKSVIDSCMIDSGWHLAKHYGFTPWCVPYNDIFFLFCKKELYERRTRVRFLGVEMFFHFCVCRIGWIQFGRHVLLRYEEKETKECRTKQMSRFKAFKERDRFLFDIRWYSPMDLQMWQEDLIRPVIIKRNKEA